MYKQPDLLSELAPSNDSFARITSIGANLTTVQPGSNYTASYPEVKRAVEQGDYVVGIATYEGLPSSMVTVGHCRDLTLIQRSDGKYEASDWQHTTIMVGAQQTSPGNFAAGGERTPLKEDDCWNHGLSDGNLVTGSNPTTDTSARRSLLYPTKAHKPAEFGPGKGHASLKTTQIVSSQQLPDLLRAVAETMGLDPQAADDYVSEAAWYVGELDEAKAQREAEALRALSAMATVAAVELPISLPKPTRGARLSDAMRRLRLATAQLSAAPLNW